MALKPRTKRTSLAFMGEGWEAAYIESRLMVGSDQEALDAIQNDKELTDQQKGAAIVKTFFYGGKGMGVNGDLVDIQPDDIEAMDIFTLGELASQVGLPDPKASEISTTTTPAEDLSHDDLSSSDTANASA